jgi:hypothetical protein
LKKEWQKEGAPPGFQKEYYTYSVPTEDDQEKKEDAKWVKVGDDKFLNRVSHGLAGDVH